MKRKRLVLSLVVVLGILTSCGSKETDKETTNTTDEAVTKTPEQVTEVKSSSITETESYKGTISDIKITMTLNYYDDGKVEGKYFYDKYKQDIPLVGTVTVNKITLKTNDGNEEFSGEIQNEIITGNWISGGKTLEFSLEVDENANRPEGKTEIVIEDIPASFDKGLIEELANNVENDEYDSVLEKYAVDDVTVNVKELNIIEDDEFSPIVEGYDTRYLFDFNGDGNNEYVNYYLEGSAGFCSFTVSKEVDGVFTEENSIITNAFFGSDRVIKYQGKYYFVIVETDLNYRNFMSIVVYGLDKDFVLERCSIELKYTDVNYETANAPSKEDEAVADSIMKDFDKYITITEYDYFKFADDSLNGKFDVNNDGVLEELLFYIDYTSSVSRATYLNLQGDQKEEDLKTLQPVFDKIKDDETLHYLNVKEVDGQNYVYIITQTNDTRDFKLTIYHLSGTVIKEISDYFVYFDTKVKVSSDVVADGI